MIHSIEYFLHNTMSISVTMKILLHLLLCSYSIAFSFNWKWIYFHCFNQINSLFYAYFLILYSDIVCVVCIQYFTQMTHGICSWTKSIKMFSFICIVEVLWCLYHETVSICFNCIFVFYLVFKIECTEWKNGTIWKA